MRRRSNAPWSGGDNVNLAVGQGDLQATPLQVAVAYAALANNGTIVTPHLGKAIEDGNGVTFQELRSKPKRKVKINQRDRQIVLDGLRRAAQEEGGTSVDVFKGWPMSSTPSTARPAPRSASPTPTRRGTPASSSTRPPDRGRGDGREGRLRGGHRGPRGASHPL